MDVQKLKEQLQEKNEIIKKFEIYYLEKQIEERDIIIKDIHREIIEKDLIKGTCDDEVEFLNIKLQEKNRILQNLLIFFEKHDQSIKNSLTEPQLKK
jgi:hypothetical protein